ncbi:shikimate dehydrogenase [Paramicrobacterium fandaimingii]|uniref:shikimate dehydrogenase n=1 Tax=Paramicrobacterium fandaimingii TaxID=2708079 RepID=UPI001F3575AE|nr:shikimate dehydrogenase [Microbacterium fandaimingii]
MSDRLAVLGSPIAHSQSPALHTAAYQVLGRSWSYERRELREHELTDFLDTCGSSWRGLSLTMPLKNAAFAASEIHDDDAEITGAVNTLRLNNGPVAGFNTDVDGIVRAVRAAGTAAPHSVMILGGGATAASAIVAAARLGASHVDVAVRAPERATALQALAASIDVQIDVRQFGSAPSTPDADLVISTLPGGVAAPEQFTAASRRRALLLDVAYWPWPSELARAWHAEQGRVINGLAMLAHQALLQVRIFDSGSPLTPLPDEKRVISAMLGAVNLAADGLA